MADKLNKRMIVGCTERENIEPIKTAVNELLGREVEFIITDIHYPHRENFVDIDALISDSEDDIIIGSSVIRDIIYGKPNMTYEVKYFRNDGSFGAYCGESKEAFIVEINNCIRAGWNFKASAKKGG